MTLLKTDPRLLRQGAEAAEGKVHEQERFLREKG